MNTHTPRAQQHRQVQSLAVLAMFTAILFLLTFTPIGMIDLPIIKATVLLCQSSSAPSFSDPRREPFWAACLVWPVF